MAKAYRVGAIGTAWAAQSPLPTFQSFDGVELAAVCSARLSRAQEAAEKFGAALAYDDYRVMLQEADLDIVYVGAPVYLHGEMAIASAKAGKHVLCEKPLALNAAEGAAMLAACRENKVGHMCAFTMRHYPWGLEMRRLAESGAIGEIRQVNCYQFFGLPAGMPPRPWTWLNDEALGGGYLGALGSHLIDLVRSFGVEFESVMGFTAVNNATYADGEGGTKLATADDTFAMLARLVGGGVMTLHFGAGNRPGTGRNVEIYGRNGTMVLDRDDQVLYAGGSDRALRPLAVPEPEMPERVRNSAVPRFGLMIEKLIDQIEGRGERSPNIEDALRCQEVLDAVRLSAQQDRVVPISEARAS